MIEAQSTLTEGQITPYNRKFRRELVGDRIVHAWCSGKIPGQAEVQEVRATKPRRILLSYGVLGLCAVILAFCAGLAAGATPWLDGLTVVNFRIMIVACVVCSGLAIESLAGLLWLAARVH